MSLAYVSAVFGLASLYDGLGSGRLWDRKWPIGLGLLVLSVFLTHRGLDLFLFGHWWIIP